MTTRAHDVAVACCLAMAEVRVRLPLGALRRRGDKEPGKLRLLVSPAPSLSLSDCGGARAGTGRRLLTVLTQVRFLPPQLVESPELRAECPESGLSASQLWTLDPQLSRKSSGWMRSLPRKQVRAHCPLWVQVPRLPPDGKQQVPLAERQRFQASNLARRVRLPRGTLGDGESRRHGVGENSVSLSPVLPVSPPQTAGSFNGRTRRSERRNAGSSPAPATS